MKGDFPHCGGARGKEGKETVVSWTNKLSERDCSPEYTAQNSAGEGISESLIIQTMSRTLKT